MGVICLLPVFYRKFPDCFIQLVPKVANVTNDLDQFKVTEVATVYYGRCYIVEIDEPVVFMGLKIEATLYFIDRGQELCVINSILGCDVQIQSVVLHKFHYDIRVEANKIVKEDR